MRLRPSEHKKARIEIVPMIDTIFFLLVFFMIASLAMTRQNGLPVNLPKADSGKPNLESRATITIDPQGRLYLEKQPVSMAELVAGLRARRERDPGVVAVINGDEAVVWGRGITVMDEVKRAGIAKVAIAVKPGESRQP